MLNINKNTKIYFAVETVDFRKQLKGLTNYVETELKKNPKSKAFFFLMSKDRTQVRILSHDGTGFCMFTKKLDSGKFGSIGLLKNFDTKLIRLSRKDTLRMIAQ